MAYIHSKPIVYVNNGTGRDTYVSGNDGGFRPLHRAGHGKGTFYNQLRKYPSGYCVSQPTRKGLAPCHEQKKVDDFQKAQDHYNPRFKREMNLVHNY